MKPTIRKTLDFPKELVDQFESTETFNESPSFSEAVRRAMRQTIKSEKSIPDNNPAILDRSDFSNISA